MMPVAVAEYVVVHELAHLRERNHGPRFWSLVESLMPDFRARRTALRG
jgi:predicted metal-dependent hydrolase